MKSSAALKLEIEAALAGKIPAALTPAARSIREVRPTGIAALDAMLEGGLPVGAVTEMVGPASSGRTTAAMAFCAQTMRDGRVCAWVDVEDTFCPESAEANGLALQQMLWVRCGQGDSGAVVETGSGTRTAPEKDLRSRMPAGGGGRHPRSEARGLEGAIEALLQSPKFSKTGGKPGTPGAVNRTIWPAGGTRGLMAACAEGTTPGRRKPDGDGYMRSSGGVIPLRSMRGVGLPTPAEEFAQRGVLPVVHGVAETRRFERKEQVNSDRAPKRRGEFLAAERAGLQVTAGLRGVGAGAPERRVDAGKPWGRLDQALRATDLLLQAGGFGAIVLDMGGVAVEFADRIPLATWFRFRTGADGSRTSLLVLTQRSDGKSCAGSSAGLVVRFEGLEMMGEGEDGAGGDAVWGGVGAAAVCGWERERDGPAEATAGDVGVCGRLGGDGTNRFGAGLSGDVVCVCPRGADAGTGAGAGAGPGRRGRGAGWRGPRRRRSARPMRERGGAGWRMACRGWRRSRLQG